MGNTLMLLLGLSFPALIAAAEPLSVRAHERWISSVAMSSDGKQAVTGSDDPSFRLWDGLTGKALLDVRPPSPITAVALRSDGNQIASGSWGGTLHLWDAAGGEKRRSVRAHGEHITAIAFSPHSPREEVLLDVRAENGRLCGTISSPQPVTMGVMDRHGLQGKPNSLPVWGKTQPYLPADNARIELMLLGIGSPGPNIISAALAFRLISRLSPDEIERREATQDPILGGNAYHFHRTTDDCAGNLYDSVEACDCVHKCSRLRH